ncbi:unnamed protein product [Mytilus coruscus]|uniref:WSC domain-containing protein n=1 Tax=Mytilus coruscus TaxID=42192 RepID=A0A6J8ER57_MYTCO|nr:unnamed protein product [Mytilus coruscus]
MSDLSQILIFAKLFGFIFGDPVYFTVNKILDDYYSTDKLLASVNTFTAVDCARQCSRQTSCQSMFYSVSDQSCLLNSVKYTSGSISKPGVRYYEKAGSTGPEIDSAVTTETFSGPFITNQIITTVRVEGSTDAVSGPTITNQITTIKAGVSTSAVSCLVIPCQNHGDCLNDNCQCKPNYAGDYCQKAYSLSGCYLISFAVETNLSVVTPLACVEACIGMTFDYAGLMGGNRCFCGTTISGGIQASTCYISCNGDSAYKCGGATTMSVYHIV